MKDGVFFLGIFILLFVVWVASGGPSRPISFAGPYLNPIQTTGTTAQAYGDPSKFSSINSDVTIGAGGVTATGGGAKPGVVRLSRDLTGARNTDPDEEYLMITVSSSAGGPVSTAGWKLVAKDGGSASFPQGAEVPRSGRVNSLTAITLRPGDQAIVTTGRSPVGISFRENMCTGYFEEHQDFHPSLAMNCPTPSQEYGDYYGDNDENDFCLTYIRSIPYCSTETSASGDASSACRNFVEDHLNYNGCFDAHQKDSGFLSSTWRIFLGKNDELWRQRQETITLLDADNKVIDSITY